MLVSDLRKTIRAVRARTQIPVSYADVWEVWLRYQELADVVDFRHDPHPALLGRPSGPRRRRRCPRGRYPERVAQAFPDKEILIGETGWPSNGRMRDAALPSRIKPGALHIRDHRAGAAAEFSDQSVRGL